MNRRHATSRLESRVPIGRSRRVADSSGISSSTTASSCCTDLSNHAPGAAKQKNLDENESEEPEKEVSKAVQPLSRSPKWSHIKNRFENGSPDKSKEVTASRIPTVRSSPLPSRGKSHPPGQHRKMPITKEVANVAVTNKMSPSHPSNVAMNLTDESTSECPVATEFKSAQLAAKQLLRSRLKKPCETAVVQRAHQNTSATSIPAVQILPSECNGTPRDSLPPETEGSCVDVQDALAPDSADTAKLQPVVPETSDTVTVPTVTCGSDCTTDKVPHSALTSAIQKDVKHHQDLPTNSKVVHEPVCLPKLLGGGMKGEPKVSVTIIKQNVEPSASADKACPPASRRTVGTVSTSASKQSWSQISAGKPEGNHITHINIEHPAKAAECLTGDGRLECTLAASDANAGNQKEESQDGKFLYTALVPYRNKKPSEERPSKVASLAKSFENLIQLDSSSQGAHNESFSLQRGNVCNRSLPLATVHDMRKKFGRPAHVSSCSTISRPLPTASDRVSTAVPKANSFRRASESSEDMQAPPKICVAVRRSNSTASQSTTYLRTENRRSQCDTVVQRKSVSVESISSRVTNRAEPKASADACLVSQTSVRQAAECRDVTHGVGATSPSGARRCGLVRQAVMNLEANNQASVHKRQLNLPLEFVTNGVSNGDTRRKSVEVPQADFQTLRNRCVSACFEGKGFSKGASSTGISKASVSSSGTAPEKKPALPPKGAVGARQFRQVPPPAPPASSEFTSQSITVSVRASVIPGASRKCGTSTIRSTSPRDVSAGCDEGDSLRASVRPNRSFLWKFGIMPQVRAPVNGSQDEYAEENIYDTLSNCRTALSSDEGVAVSENASEKSAKNSPVQGISGRVGSLSKTRERRFQASSVDSDEGWADVSDYEFDNGKGPSCESKKTAHRKDRRAWSQNLRELVAATFNTDDDGSDKGYEEITWELVDTGDSSSSSTTYDHLYEPIYDLLEKDGAPPDLIPETDNVYTVPHEHAKPPQRRPFSPTGGAAVAASVSTHLSPEHKNKSNHRSDIQLQLSSRFNLVKIKKNVKSATEIGVGVHVEDPDRSKPKRKAFVDCILRQRQSHTSSRRNSVCGSTSKKETATFYVCLSVDGDMFDSQKHGHSDGPEAGKANAEEQPTSPASSPLKARTGMPPRNAPRRRAIRRASSSAGAIRRPRTPPPLPPVAAKATETASTPASETQHGVAGIQRSESSLSFFSGSAVSGSRSGSDSLSPLDDTFPVIFGTSLMSDLASYTNISVSDSPSNVNNASPGSCTDVHSDENGAGNGFEKSPSRAETLKSPFLEEPLYQFYQKDFVQRAWHWNTTNGCTVEEDDGTSAKKVADGSVVEGSDSEDQRSDHEYNLGRRRSAMELLQSAAGTGLRTLWCEVPEVIASGVLAKMTPHEARLQEAMFEVITSEASYLKSLNVLVDHFVRCPEFRKDSILHEREHRALFADILPVRVVCENLLADFEKRWNENIVISDVCDILHKHAMEHFSVYVRYCSNQVHQDRLLKELRETRPEFVEALHKLEADPKCHGLNMYSFLMLPMQRITRLPLLVDAIFKRLDIDSPGYQTCQETLAVLNKIVADCNEGAKKMERMEEMLHISHILEFRDCKAVPLISSSRWLVKRGELLRISFDPNAKRTFGRAVRYSKTSLYLFLFTDLLMLTKKKGEEYYCVLDYCPRNMVQITSADGEDSGIFLPPRLPECCRNLFQMTLLQNHEGKMAEMLLSTVSESEKTRWIDALTPAVSSNPEERIYEEWDCPQVQCRHAYIPEQPDELALEESDVVNVFRKLSDGWYEGERIRDGARGWFPASHTVEVINLHVRSRNLRQRYRLLMASQNYLEGQLRARNGSKGK